MGWFEGFTVDDFPPTTATRVYPFPTGTSFAGNGTCPVLCSDGRVMTSWVDGREVRLGYAPDLDTYLTTNNCVVQSKVLFTVASAGTFAASITDMGGVFYMVVTFLSRTVSTARGMHASITGVPTWFVDPTQPNFYDANTNKGGAILLESTDDGATWQYAAKLFEPAATSNGNFGDNAPPGLILDVDGTWMVPACFTAGTAPANSRWTTYYSSNGAAGPWSQSGLNFGSNNFSYGIRQFGRIGPYLIAGGRTGSVHLAGFRSTDGVTWTQYENFASTASPSEPGWFRGVGQCNIGSTNNELLVRVRGGENVNNISIWSTDVVDFKPTNNTEAAVPLNDWTQDRLYAAADTVQGSSAVVVRLGDYIVFQWRKFHYWTFFPLPGDCLPPGPLRIPYVEWPLTQDQTRWLVMWEQNWQAIDRWANSATGANADCALKVPYLRELTPERIKANYLALERWANCMCKVGNQSSLQLRVPRKDWTIEAPAWDTQNLSELERWVDRIRRS